MNEARCSVNWKMYAPNGAQMQFTVRDDDPDLHLALLDSYLEALHLRGFSVSEPGLNEGEKQEEINGYVLGESKKGDACVFLYSSKAALQWRIATVYVEKFGDLPFKPAGKKWEASAAPERAEAEKKGFLTTVPAFKIVLEAQEPDAEGKIHWRFARVVPSATPQPVTVVTSKLVTSDPPSDPAWEELTSAAEKLTAYGNSKPVPRLAVNKAGADFGKFATTFASKHSAWQNKLGNFDFEHICASVAKLGYAEITAGNIIEVFNKLEAYALSKEADEATGK